MHVSPLYIGGGGLNIESSHKGGIKKKNKPKVRMDPKHLDILNVMDLFFNKLDDDFVDNVAKNVLSSFSSLGTLLTHCGISVHK